MKVSLLLVVTLLIGCARSQSTFKCYSCSANLNGRYGRSYNCLANITALRSVTCRKGYYCLTTFAFSNGVMQRVRRTCQNPATDYDYTTNVAPIKDSCTSSYSTYNSAGTVNCYYHCTTNECNNQTPSLAKICPKACPNNCNPYTKKCPPLLKCVQCNSEKDPTCEKKTKATACPQNMYNYCAATKVITLDSGLRMRALRTTVTKSCTSARYSRLPSQTCRFSTNRRYNQPKEIDFVCSTFCKTNGCNKNIPTVPPNDNQSKGLYCAICTQTGVNGNCNGRPVLIRCPSTATLCKTTVRYYVSNNHFQKDNPQVQIASIDRQCASKPVVTQCTSYSLKKIGLVGMTCQETCNTNGCNVGWPARPKCSQCNSSLVIRNMSPKEAFDNCRNNPPPPSPCKSPAHAYCSTIATNTGEIAGYQKSLARVCSYQALSSNCKNVNAGGSTIRNCHMSCSDNGCNQGVSFTGQ